MHLGAVDTPKVTLRPQFENYGVGALFTGPGAATICFVAWPELLASLGLSFLLPFVRECVKLDYLQEFFLL